MKSYPVLLGIFFLALSCKQRVESSEAKSLNVVNSEGGVEIVYQPLDQARLADHTANTEFRDELQVTKSQDKPTSSTGKAPNFGNQTNVCFALCKKGTDGTNPINGKFSDSNCEVSGYTTVAEILAVAAKMSPGAQDLVFQALSPKQVLLSGDNPSYQEMKSGLSGIIKTDENRNKICSGEDAEGGLGLTGDLFLSPICFKNNTNSTVRIDATVKYKMRGYRNLQETTAYWTYSAGEDSCLNVNGCEDNDDGLCKLAAIKYVASIGGRSFQNNGSGVEFRNSRNSDDKYEISLSGGSSGGGGGGGGGGSGGGSSQDVCAEALKEVYNNYGSGSFQSARATEVKNCLNATLKTDWGDFRAHYYCQFPGSPVRQCFTYGAAALKKQGFSQDQAYKAMFQTCKANGSFDSFTSNILTNFEAAMLQNVNCNGASIDRFYQWLGISRPVR
jgi:hypothetical protein